MESLFPQHVALRQSRIPKGDVSKGYDRTSVALVRFMSMPKGAVHDNRSSSNIKPLFANIVSTPRKPRVFDFYKKKRSAFVVTPSDNQRWAFITIIRVFDADRIEVDLQGGVLELVVGEACYYCVELSG